MAAEPKYKKLLNQAFANHLELFQKFVVLNADYADRTKRAEIQDEFQEIGQEVKDILLECEEELCCFAEAQGHTTGTLSEKFWNEVRKYFAYIDQVGVIIKKL